MKRLKNLPRIYIPLLCICLLATVLNVSMTLSQPVSAHTTSAAVTAATSPVDIRGTWEGQGTYYNGQSGFDMLLTITEVNGNTFSGTLKENTYNSTVAINGSITSSSDTSSTITFTDPSTISGGQIHWIILTPQPFQMNMIRKGQLRGVGKGDFTDQGRVHRQPVWSGSLSTTRRGSLLAHGVL